MKEQVKEILDRSGVFGNYFVSETADEARELLASEICYLFEPKGGQMKIEKPPVITDDKPTLRLLVRTWIGNPFHDTEEELLESVIMDATRIQRDDTYQKMLDAIEPLIQQAKAEVAREIFEEIETWMNANVFGKSLNPTILPQDKYYSWWQSLKSRVEGK